MPGEIPIHEVTGGDDGRGNQLRFMLDVLGRRWKSVLFWTALGSAIWGAVALWQTPVRHTQYEGYTDLIVRESPWETPLMRGFGGQPTVKTTPKAIRQRTNIRNLAEDAARSVMHAELEGDLIVGSIWTENELEDYTQSLLNANGLELLELGEGNILRVRSAARTKDEAEHLAEYAARVLVDQNREIQLEEEQGALRLVQGQLEQMRSELDRVENLEWNYRLEMGLRTPSELTTEIDQMQKEIQKKRSARDEILNQISAAEAQLESTVEAFPSALDNVTESVVGGLLSDLDDLLKRQLELSRIFTDAYQPLQDLRAEIEEKQSAILAAVERLEQGSGGSQLWRKRQDLYRNRVTLSSRLLATQIELASLDRYYNELLRKRPELASKDFEYQKIVHERDQVRDQFKRLLDKEWSIRTTLERGTSQVERQNAVIVAPFTRGLQPKRWVGFVLGGIVGLLFGFGLGMVTEAMDTSIRSADDVNRHIGLEVIGQIPEMRFGKRWREIGARRRGAYIVSSDKAEIDACIVTQHDPKSPISEAYRHLRTSFQFATLNDKPKTIMVTSAVPGEGKTTTAANMAVTLADSGMRVLIVDTDLRRPNVHRVLKMERGPGLADVLREGIDIQSVTRPTRVENLWIISSGRVPPNPSELIGSDLMRQVISKLGESFDIVICDAPSILVVTDPVLLATHVDSMVLVVSANYATRQTIQRAVKLMQTARVKIAGVLLNAVKAGASGGGYYYYYYYDEASSRRGYRSSHI